MRRLSGWGFGLALVCLLLACGGGGGSEPSARSTNNPLQKYQGTYYVCEDHTREKIVIDELGENSMTLAMSADIYAEDNCSGAVVGTYTLPQPVVANYQSQALVTLPPITVLPETAVADTIILSAPAMKAQLTGSGVSGSCVAYTNGNICFGALERPAQRIFGGIYLNGDYLVELVMNNGILDPSGLYSRNPSFNLNLLIRDF